MWPSSILGLSQAHCPHCDTWPRSTWAVVKATPKIVDATLDVLDDLLHDKLDSSRPILVLIESQMTSVMKMVQTVINTYFKIHARYLPADIATRCVSARHKLELIERWERSGQYTPQSASKRAATQYKKNKTDAVGFAQWLLTHKYPEVWLNAFLAHRKKDDISDAFLMVVSQARAS